MDHLETQMRRKSLNSTCCLFLMVLLALGCRQKEEDVRPMSRRDAFERRKAREARTCPERPNLLIITLDTLRYDATSLAPRASNHTPVLERLAAEGIEFSRCYSTHDSTPLSHSSLFTGYVNATGNPQLDRAEASIAHQLGRIGYSSFAVVANGNLSPRAFATTRAFGENVNLHDMWMAMSDAQKSRASPAVDARIRYYDAQPTDWYRMVVWADAERVLEAFDANLSVAAQPFLAFVNILDSHEPYFPDPRRYKGQALEKELRSEPPPAPRYRTVSRDLADPSTIRDAKRRELVQKKVAQTNGRPWAVTLDLDDAALKIYRMRYDAEVRELDQAVGRIMEMIERRRLRESTIVVITSDHGESFGEAGFLTHSLGDQGDLEATHRVPMIMLFPRCYGLAPARIDAHCTIADVTPTIYDLVRVDASDLWSRARPGEVGRSLLPLIRFDGTGRQTKAEAKGWREITPAEKRKTDEEAVKRLRSLGYLQ